jgi:hypothetical protein
MDGSGKPPGAAAADCDREEKNFRTNRHYNICDLIRNVTIRLHSDARSYKNPIDDHLSLTLVDRQNFAV